MVDGNDGDFVRLVELLDEEYVERFGEVALQYRQYNNLDDVICGFLVYENEIAVACGGFKRYCEDTAEIKRVFVMKEYRRRHFAKEIVMCCEEEAKKRGFLYMVLETGAKMPEAIALYQGSGYCLIDNFGEFVGDDVCVCMKKSLSNTF